MLLAFITAIFLGAGLLFLVQPMVAKVLLPSLGGGPAVWNTCMVFFQMALLVGYGYAHLLSKVRSRGVQVGIHVLLLAYAGWKTLPTPSVMGDANTQQPQWWLVQTLAIMVGPAYVMVAATGPLLQQWFSRSGHARARDPYFLYVASNAGSMLGLAAYPFFIERTLTRAEQSSTWAGGYLMLGVCVLMAGLAAMWSARQRAAEGPSSQEPGAAVGISPAMGAERERGGWGWWVVLAMVPSALLMGVTQHIATDVASVPLVWIVPLLLYLATFVLAFATGRGRVSAMAWGRVLPVGVVLLAVTLVAMAQKPIVVLIAIHLGVFFLAAMMCHTRLADARPEASRLTAYYLAISVGGVAGSLVSGIVAPLVFSSVLEYPIALAAACLVRPQWRAEWRGVRSGVEGVACAVGLALLALSLERVQPALTRTLVASVGQQERGEMLVRLIVVGLPCAALTATLLGRGAARFAGGVAGLLVGSALLGVGVGGGGRVLERERTFFGVHRVVLTPDGKWHALMHGTTQHGLQSVDPAKAGLATTYYSEAGPLGEIFRMLRARGAGGEPIRAGFIGLGAGTAATYARGGDEFVFYEIDPAVARIAQDRRWFTFLSDARERATIDVTIGDGRLALAKETRGAYDLIVVDAFSSDAIPLHLMTTQAMDVYLRQLRPGGVVAFHVSSRYFDLAPVVARIGLERGLVVRVNDDMSVSTSVDSQGRTGSTWAVVARESEDLGNLARRGMWMAREVDRARPAWTDDRADPIGSMLGW